MPAIVFAAPYVPPAPVVLWRGLDMTWTGWDGSVWSLTSAADGAVMLSGVRGLTMPPIVHYKSSYPSVAGARWRGLSVDEREAFWPIQIYHDASSEDWITRDRAFWRTMNPEKTGLWTVSQPSGERRTLRLRFKNDGQATFNTDPSLAGWSNYGITLNAEQPFWAGAQVNKTFDVGASVPFLGSVPGAAPFTISPSNTISTAVMDNPGDVDAYPVWEVSGPCTSAVVGVNGRNIVIPFFIAAGQSLIIDTKPTSQMAMLGGVDKTAALGDVDFAPLPAGVASDLSLSMTGTGTITVHLEPLYYRAW